MARQLLNPNQIGGVYNENLYQDIMDLVENDKRYVSPVIDIESLPIAKNLNGDVSFVVSEDEFYRWNTKSSTWLISSDESIKRISFELPILKDDQELIHIPMSLGTEGGIANISSIEVKVNGINQIKEIDYRITCDTSVFPYTANLQWFSSDFSLETSDAVIIVSDIIVK